MKKVLKKSKNILVISLIILVFFSFAKKASAQSAITRHDQIVGCTYGLVLDLGIFGGREILGIPGPCRLPNFLSFLNNYLIDFRFTKRLTDWYNRKPPHEEDYSSGEFIREYKEWRGQTCIGPFVIPTNISFEVFGIPVNIDIASLIPWVSFIPNYEWHLCFDNPFKFNFWSNLFPLVPFSSTEDRLGEVTIKNYQFTPPVGDFRLIYTELTNVQPADLFVPHMEEGVGVADWLQKTYAPQGADLENVTDSGYVPTSLYCNLTHVRTNPGDDLFPGEISATLNYTAQTSCDFAYYDPSLPGNLCEKVASGECRQLQSSGTVWQWCEPDYGNMDCGSSGAGALHCIGLSANCQEKDRIDPGACRTFSTDANARCYPEEWSGNCLAEYGGVLCGDGYICANECDPPTEDAPNIQACSEAVYVNLPLETKTPLADSVWARLVAGSSAVFRRIFPRVGDGGAVERIWDIPSSTGARYSSSNGEVIAGDPRTLKSGTNAEIYFPHIGGVKEYFLEGIQTALRPLGYGYEILSDEPPEQEKPVDGTCDTQDSEIPDKYLGQIKTQYLISCNALAGDNLADECYNTVVKRSTEEGVNPAFSLSIWLNESGCSNYDVGSYYDFGAAFATPQNFFDQLNAFLEYPFQPWFVWCMSQPVFDSPMHAFLVLYRAGDPDGDCNPNSTAGNDYYNQIKDLVWPSVAGFSPYNCPLPNSPTDNSCP